MFVIIEKMYRKEVGHLKPKISETIIDYVNTVFSFIALNLVFIVCCIPIITIGPAIAALYQVTMKEARGEYGYLIRSYWKHFKEMFWQALFTFLLLVLLIMLLAFVVVFWKSLDSAFSFAAIILSYLCILHVIMVTIYVFPLMARFKNTFTQTIKNAFFVSLTNLKFSFIILIANVFEVSLIYLFTPMRVFMFFIGFSFFAYCNSFLFNKFFQKFEPITSPEIG